MDNTMRTVFVEYIRLKRNLEIEKRNKQKQKVLEKLNNKNGIIFLQKDPNKKTILIFLDPNCPYCIQKIKNTNFKKLLKNANVGIVFRTMMF